MLFDTDITSLKSLNHYLQKLVKDRLWLKVLIGLFLGVGFGLLLSPSFGWVGEETSKVLGNWLALPGMLFLKLVQMIMIPLIVASIITGIASNDKENLRKLGGSTLLYFVSTTACLKCLILSFYFRMVWWYHSRGEDSSGRKEKKQSSYFFSFWRRFLRPKREEVRRLLLCLHKSSGYGSFMTFNSGMDGVGRGNLKQDGHHTFLLHLWYGGGNIPLILQASHLTHQTTPTTQAFNGQ